MKPQTIALKVGAGAVAFVAGVVVQARRMPRTLAAMTDEELAVLAQRVAGHRRFTAPKPSGDFVDVNARVAEAEAAAHDEHLRRVEAGMGG